MIRSTFIKKWIFFQAFIQLYLLVFIPLFSFSQTKTKPNILFILSDDQSVPHLSCYGDQNIKTPNIDDIAKNGLMLTNLYVSSPQCVPSRSSLMTGRNPVDTRMTRFSAPLQRDIITLPEILRTGGYYTGIQGRSYHLDGSSAKSPQAEAVFKELNLRTFHDRADSVSVGPDNENLRRMQAFLDARPKDRPFYLWVNYSNPHRPHTATKKFCPDPDNLKLPPDYPDTRLLREDLARYYGEVQQLDFYVGQLLQDIKKRGLFDNTIIVFMGDNGASLLRGKGTLYQTGVRVPLVMCWGNKIKKGSVSNALLSADDLAPTLIELADLKPDAKMSGKSFKPLVLNQDFEGDEYVFSERGAHGDNLPTSTGSFDIARCVIGKQFKLIYNVLPTLSYTPVDFSGQPFWKELVEMNKKGSLDPSFKQLLFKTPRPMFELFDLKNDPYEMNNLYDKPAYQNIQNELLTALNRWMIIYQDFPPLPVKYSGKGH